MINLGRHTFFYVNVYPAEHALSIVQGIGGTFVIFLHAHPYEIYIPKGTTRVIIGTLPPPRFSTGDLKKEDVDFCYGSCDGTLWPILEAIFRLKLRYDNSREAVDQRKEFLISHRLGICDIVESCLRDEVNASDLGMRDIRLRDIIGQLRRHQSVATLLFAGGNSKNGPEYFFRQQLKQHGLSLECMARETPRQHQFLLDDRIVTTVSLTSPSNAANRSIGATQLYKKRKQENPDYTTFDYRVEQYREVFAPKTEE